MRRILDRTKYLTFSLFMLVLLAELFLRLFKGENMVIHQFPLIYTYDPVTGFKGIPNAQSYFRRPGIKKIVKLNSFGFSGREFSADHPDSVYRIMIFGTSDVEGLWSDDTPSLPEKLEERLRSAHYRAEVINCAVSGVWRGLQTVALVRSTAARFHANMILLEMRIPFWSGNYTREIIDGEVVSFAGNDSAELSHSKWIGKQELAMVKRHRLMTDLYDMFYLPRFVTRSCDPQPGSLLYCWQIYAEDNPACWQFLYIRKDSLKASIDTLNHLSQELETDSCRLLLFKYDPAPPGGDTDKYPGLTPPRIYLDVDLEDKKNHLKLDAHPNEHGKQMMADAFFSALVPKQIPPRFREK